jgi:serine/threonine protein kinase
VTLAEQDISVDHKDPSAPKERSLHLVGRVAVPSEPSPGEPRPSEESVPLLGQLIGNYRIVAKIAQGGMGTVYEAVHQHIGRRAAIKILGPELSRDVENATRFLNEARAVNLVKHHGLVQIFEFGQLPDDTSYIIMEFLEGESLATRMERAGGRLGVEGMRLARQIATTLAATHQRGVIHRDLKPSNVMIVPDSEAPGGERTKILDFGIAKVVSRPDKDSPHFQTGNGVVLGTPIYMAPEQCRATGHVDDKADVYSLGVMLYQMLCGQPPFMAKEPVEVMAMHLCMTPRPLRERDPTISEDLSTLINSMLAKSPTDRPTMNQVAAELERLEGPPRVRPSLQTLEEFFAARDLRESSTPALPVTPRWQPFLLLSTFLMGLAALALGAWAWFGYRRGERPPPERPPLAAPQPPAAQPPAPVLPEAPAAAPTPAPAARPAPRAGGPAKEPGKAPRPVPKHVVKGDEDVEIFR